MFSLKPPVRGRKEKMMGFTSRELLEYLANCFFGGTWPWGNVAGLLFIIGEWGLLQKSGLKGWWALIPCAREYQLARCAGREPEGRILSMAEFGRILTNGAMYIARNQGGIVASVFLVAEITLEIVAFLYRIQVFSGLIEVYGTGRRWMWLWVLHITRWIPALIWGWEKKYRPEWQVEDLRREMLVRASSGSTTVLDQGLTVNLKERSTRDFFQKKILLWDIHMVIPQGHMVLLLGGSGAGKTTLVNAINGYEKANAEIMLNGSNMYTQYKHMQYETGFVPQQELVRNKDTVYYTLMDAAKLRLPKDVPGDARRKRVEEVMEIFGLTAVRNRLVQKLSGGQKKRLSIAMELISNPALFILDEPDSGLDGVMARELMQQLRKTADTGKIVIVITHTPDRVIEFFDDVIVLAKDSARTGRLAFYGSIREAREFFGCEKMEEIVKLVNRPEEGGAGMADAFIAKYMEVQHA